MCVREERAVVSAFLACISGRNLYDRSGAVVSALSACISGYVVGSAGWTMETLFWFRLGISYVPVARFLATVNVK